MEDTLIIGGRTFRSRLFIGTGKYASVEQCRAAIRASGAGWQGGTDEYWGVDALRISMSGGNNVPEPATWGLVAVAGLAAAFARRRRTQG